MFPPAGEATEAEGFDGLLARARGLASQIAQLQAELVSVYRALDALEVEGSVDPLRLVFASQVGLTRGETARVARLASRLEGLPALSGAFAAGRLSEGTLDLLGRVATPANEQALLDAAEVATPDQLSRIVAAYQHAHRGDTDDPEPEPPTENFTSGVGADGMWHGHARLRADRGAIVDAAIRRVIDDDQPEEHSPERLTRAEALVQLAQQGLAAERAEGYAPTTSQVVIAVEADKIGPDGVVDDGAHVTDGGPVDLATLEELLCDCLHSVVRLHCEQPVTTTSPTRLATPAQRRALLVRDRHCRYPGCGRTRYLVAHHVIEHHHGGPTRLDNMVLLCQTHHGRIHRNGWALTLDDHGHTQVTDPTGAVIPHQRPARPPGQPPPPPGQRPRPTGERFTPDAAGEILHHWQHHDRQRHDPAA